MVGLPRGIDFQVQPDARVLVFTLAVAVLTRRGRRECVPGHVPAGKHRRRFIGALEHDDAFDGGVLLEPLLELNDFEGIGGRGEGLGEERIGIECDGCDERVEFDGRNFCCRRLSFRGCSRALRLE